MANGKTKHCAPPGSQALKTYVGSIRVQDINKDRCVELSEHLSKANLRLVLENFSGCCKNSGQNGHQQQNKHQIADKTSVAAKNKAAKGHIMR